MMEIEDYKKALESMSREELLNEISNLISSNVIQLQNKNIELEELKSALARANLQLQFQIGEVDIKNIEIERLTEEKKTAWRKFKQKVDESIELSMLLDKRAGEKAELQKQVDELTKHLHKAVTLIKENSDLWFKYKFGVEVE